MFLCLAKLNALTSQLLKKMREDINGCSGGRERYDSGHQE